MQERMPYVAQTPEGHKWVTKSGLNLGLAYGKGSTGPIAAQDDQSGMATDILDDMTESEMSSDAESLRQVEVRR